MSPPKNYFSNTNHHSSNTNKPSPGYNNSSNGGQKNVWNSPNQRTRLDFNGSNNNNSGGNNNNSNQKKESAYKIYNQTPQNIGTGTGVPSSTMEQSPAPHHLPIPFGLSTPTFEDSAIITSNSLPFETSKPKSLLNTLFPSTEVKSSNIQQQLDFSSEKNNKVI